jgi:hypothetical protein
VSPFLVALVAFLIAMIAKPHGVKATGFIVAIIAFLVGMGSSIDAAPTGSPRPTGPTVDVEFISDPPDAVLNIEGQARGRTPITVSVPAERLVQYNLLAREPYGDYNLYKPFNGTLEVSEPTSVSVWIDRTTAEEQAAQIRAAQERRKAAEQAQREEEARRQRELEAKRLYYRINTDCRRGVDLTYSNAYGDTTQQGNQGNGWYYSFHPRQGQFLYLSAQNQCDYGYITVKFVKNGVTIRENTSTGGYSIATISGRW